MNSESICNIIDSRAVATKRKHSSNNTLSQKRPCTIADLSTEEFERLTANQKTARFCCNATLLVSRVSVAREPRLLPELLGYSVSEHDQNKFHEAVEKFFRLYVRSTSKLLAKELNQLRTSDGAELRAYLEEGVFKIWLKSAGASGRRAPLRMISLASCLKEEWCRRLLLNGRIAQTNEHFEKTLATFVEQRREQIKELLSAPLVTFKRDMPNLIAGYSTELQADLIRADISEKRIQGWEQKYRSQFVFPSSQGGDAALGGLGVCWAVSARVHAFWTRRPDASIDDLYTQLQYEAAEGYADSWINPNWILTSKDRFHQAMFRLSAALPPSSARPWGTLPLIPEMVLRRLQLERGPIVILDLFDPSNSPSSKSLAIVEWIQREFDGQAAKEEACSFLFHVLFEDGTAHAVQLRIHDQLNHHSFFDSQTGAWANFSGREEFFFAFRGYLEAYYPTIIRAYLERLPKRTASV